MISLNNIIIFIGCVLILVMLFRKESYEPVNPLTTGFIRPLFDYRERPLPHQITRHATMSELPFCTPLLEATGRCIGNVTDEIQVPYEQNKI